MQHDARGLALTAPDAAAAGALDACIEAYLESAADIAERLKALKAAGAEMPLAHCLEGYLMLLSGLGAYLPRAHAALAAAERLAAHATPRERRHVEALRAWCAGDLRRACRTWDELLVEWPHDILAFRLAHFLHFYVGALAEMRDSAASTIARWDESIPGYHFVEGCRGFALEENGDYAAAEPLARAATEANPRDIWSGHAMAHVLEMTGRPREGIAWVERFEDVWRESGAFNNHIWWHRALYQLELGLIDAALDSFDRLIWPAPAEDNLAIANATSLLMRLEMRGIPVGDRWDRVVAMCERRAPDRVRPFNDLHFVMGLAMAGQAQAAEAVAGSMRRFAEAHPGREVTVAGIYRDAGIPVADAIIAFARGDDGRVIELMRKARYAMRPLGGSWAQRDVWEEMLATAAERSGRTALARALLAERVARKPRSITDWRRYARVLEGEGEPAAAAAARARAEALLAG